MGQINLVSWRQLPENVDFKAGDVLSLQNIVVSTFQQQITVTTSFETSVNVIEKDIAVTEEAKALDKTVQMKTMALTIKNFQSVSKCYLCRSATMPQQSHARSLTIDCTTCGSSFLKTKGGFSNQCSVMLLGHNWYNARYCVLFAVQFICRYLQTSVGISMLAFTYSNMLNNFKYVHYQYFDRDLANVGC